MPTEREPDHSFDLADLERRLLAEEGYWPSEDEVLDMLVEGRGGR